MAGTIDGTNLDELVPRLIQSGEYILTYDLIAFPEFDTVALYIRARTKDPDSDKPQYCLRLEGGWHTYAGAAAAFTVEDMGSEGQLVKWHSALAAAAMRRSERSLGINAIAEERRRQVEKEGWTPEHDDEHERCELWRAARSYLVFAYAGERDDIPVGWPWDEDDWKPSEDPIRNLVKAGALIAAELDRLFRKESAQRPTP
jgi:hypothetical protein